MCHMEYVFNVFCHVFCFMWLVYIIKQLINGRELFLRTLHAPLLLSLECTYPHGVQMKQKCTTFPVLKTEDCGAEWIKFTEDIASPDSEVL